MNNMYMWAAIIIIAMLIAITTIAITTIVFVPEDAIGSCKRACGFSTPNYQHLPDGTETCRCE